MTEKSDIELVWIKAIQEFMPDEITAVIAEELIGENRPKPPSPFVTVKLISGPIAVGSDENLRVDGSDFVLTSLRQFTVSLQSFGEGSFSALSLFQTRLYGVRLPAFLKKSLDISIVDRGNVQNISEIQNVGFERRQQIDIVFNIASNVSEQIDSIETVEISGKIKSQNGIERDVEKIIVVKP